MDHLDPGSLEADFERMVMEDDDSASQAMLAAGLPIHIANDDTPAGHVVRVHPDGRKELIRFDWEAAARVLGR